MIILVFGIGLFSWAVKNLRLSSNLSVNHFGGFFNLKKRGLAENFKKRREFLSQLPLNENS